ncbi:MAG TPA: DUF4870 domain-containing protein [Blastocatellia bacterium]|nr:DUF4870 domain-containing protein [Blastocatellia bacterium]
MYETSKDDRTWGLLCHLAGFAAFTAIPFANILGPLVVWLIKKDQSWFVNDQGKEAMNFQISMTVYFIIAGILIFILVGIPLLIVLGIGWLVLMVIAAIKANEGVTYRYPLTLRFIK